jgi:hypothetical protein
MVECAGASNGPTEADRFARARAKLMWMGMVTDQPFIAFKHIVDNRTKTRAPEYGGHPAAQGTGAEREMGELLAEPMASSTQFRGRDSSETMKASYSRRSAPFIKPMTR